MLERIRPGTSRVLEPMTETCADTCPDFVTYHRDLADLVERREPGLWRWFASDELTSDVIDQQRLELLKSTYRLDRTSHKALHEAADTAAAKLGLEAPVTLYQAEGQGGRNAALIYMPGEVHVVFFGDMLKALDGPETLALLGHELAHFRHFAHDGGRYFVLDRLLDWITGEPDSAASFAESRRLFRLWLEIYADRVALWVCGDRDAAIRTLVKATTGIDQVSPEAYLKQAAEAIEGGGDAPSQGHSHPETFLRARALELWAEGAEDAEARIAKLIAGEAKIEALDLLGQQRMTLLTRDTIRAFLAEPEMRCEAVEAAARAILPDILADLAIPGDLPERVEALPPSLAEYLCFILLDLATAEPDLGDGAIDAAARVAATLGLSGFPALAAKELRLTKKRREALGATGEAEA